MKRGDVITTKNRASVSGIVGKPLLSKIKAFAALTDYIVIIRPLSRANDFDDAIPVSCRFHANGAIEVTEGSDGYGDFRLKNLLRQIDKTAYTVNKRSLRASATVVTVIDPKWGRSGKMFSDLAQLLES